MTNVPLLSSKVKIRFKLEKEGKKKSYKFDSDSKKLVIYNNFAPLNEVLALTINKKKCIEKLPGLEISWTAVADELKSRSYDDIRNNWNFTLYPLLSTGGIK